jgi:hypothetical protein
MSTGLAKEGDELVALLDGTRITLMRGVTDVGCIENVPAALASQIEGMGSFTCAKIDRMNPLSETAEVRIWRWNSDEEQ